jgi:ATP-dependent DNA helicase RecG
MTATPIPRTLTMTAFGDMDVSQLTEKPAGRQPVDTRVIPLTRIQEVVQSLERALQHGKVYWICPLVEEREEDIFKDDVAAAESRFKELQKTYGNRVALMHGKMPMADREIIMEKFASNEYDILVATTVVEVGVNVPEATVMIIEQAERFGLAQLHQLRGRVGRGDKPSQCILLYNEKCSEQARERLSVIRETNDGFIIAEKDLELRGAGEVLGTKQSGMPEFYFTHLALHKHLVELGRNKAISILKNDPHLQQSTHTPLHTLLHLFGYAETIEFLQ